MGLAPYLGTCRSETVLHPSEMGTFACSCLSAMKANTAHNGGCDPLLTPPLEEPKVSWATGALDDEPVNVAVHISVCICLPGSALCGAATP